MTFQVAFGQTSSGVDIIVEPSSYIPQLYKGKPLFASQGTARIIAVPNIFVNGRKVSSKNLIFKWTKDDTVISSDTNTDSITINGSVPIRDINIDVQVLDSSGNILAENSRLISVNNPKILLYENNSLYGVLLNRALVGNYSLGNKEELSVVAKPYFFDITGQAGDDIDYKWSVNGNPFSSSDKKNELILRQTNTGGMGSVSVSVDVNNLSRIFQFSNTSFGLSFGQ